MDRSPSRSRSSSRPRPVAASTQTQLPPPQTQTQTTQAHAPPHPPPPSQQPPAVPSPAATPLWAAPLKSQLERLHVHSPAALSPLNPGSVRVDAGALAPLALPAPELALAAPASATPPPQTHPSQPQSQPQHRHQPLASALADVPPHVQAALAQFASDPHHLPAAELLSMLQTHVSLPSPAQAPAQAPAPPPAAQTHTSGTDNGQLAPLLPLIASILAPQNGANQAQAHAAGARVLQALSDYLNVQATNATASDANAGQQDHTLAEFLHPAVLPAQHHTRVSFDPVVGDSTPHSPWGPHPPSNAGSSYASPLFVGQPASGLLPAHGAPSAPGAPGAPGPSNTSAFSTPYAFSTGASSSAGALSLPHTPANGLPVPGPEMDMFVPLVSPALGMRAGQPSDAADALQPFADWLQKQPLSPTSAAPAGATSVPPPPPAAGSARSTHRRGASSNRSRARPSPLIKPQGSNRSRRTSRDGLGSPADAMGNPAAVAAAAAALEALRPRHASTSSQNTPQSKHRSSTSAAGLPPYADVPSAVSAPTTPAALFPHSSSGEPGAHNVDCLPPPTQSPMAPPPHNEAWRQTFNALWADSSHPHAQPPSARDYEARGGETPVHHGGHDGHVTGASGKGGDDDGMCWIHSYDDTPSPIQLEGPGSSGSAGSGAAAPKSGTSNASSTSAPNSAGSTRVSRTKLPDVSPFPTSFQPAPSTGPTVGGPAAAARPGPGPGAVPLTPATLMGLDAMRAPHRPSGASSEKVSTLPTIPQAPEPDVPSQTTLLSSSSSSSSAAAAAAASAAVPAPGDTSQTSSRRTSYRGSSTVPASPAFGAMVASPAFLARAGSLDLGAGSGGGGRAGLGSGQAQGQNAVPETPPILKAPRKCGKGKSGKGTEANRITFHAAAAAAKKAAASRENAAKEAALEAQAAGTGSVAAEQRRTSHKAAEQKRRDSLKDSFDDLRDVLPAIILDEEAEGGSVLAPDGLPEDEAAEGFNPAQLVPPEHARQVNRGISKAAVLRHGNEYLHRVQARLARREALLLEAREENLALRALLTALVPDITTSASTASAGSGSSSSVSPGSGCISGPDSDGSLTPLWLADTPTLATIRAARDSVMAPRADKVQRLYAPTAALLSTLASAPDSKSRAVPLDLPVSAMPAPDPVPSPPPGLNTGAAGDVDDDGMDTTEV